MTTGTCNTHPRLPVSAEEHYQLAGQNVYPNLPPDETFVHVWVNRPVQAALSRTQLLVALAFLTIENPNFDPRYWCAADAALLERIAAFLRSKPNPNFPQADTIAQKIEALPDLPQPEALPAAMKRRDPNAVRLVQSPSMGLNGQSGPKIGGAEQAHPLPCKTSPTPMSTVPDAPCRMGPSRLDSVTSLLNTSGDPPAGIA